jgi:hypothetical protein
MILPSLDSTLVNPSEVVALFKFRRRILTNSGLFFPFSAISE